MTTPAPVSPAVKLFVLAILALQNSGITLVTRYSRGVLKEQYAVITTVIVSELIKLVFSIGMIARLVDWNLTKAAHRIIHVIRYSLIMSVPGLIYLIQNKLTYVGLQNLESASYSMLSQLKLLTTAVFSVMMLRKKLYGYQWRALILLFIGVILIQVGPGDGKAKTGSKQGADAWLGTLAVIGVATLSGLAGVYFEYVLKGSVAFNMWDRNVQLSLFGIIFGFLSIPLSSTDMQFFQLHDVFFGWSWWTIAVVLLASLGGLLVSIAVAYTDNILKNFATSVAILLTSAISYSVFGDLQPDTYFICGTGAVLLAVFNYNEDVKGIARSLGMIELTLNSGSSSSGGSGSIGGGGGVTKSFGSDPNASDDEADTEPENSDQGDMELKPLVAISTDGNRAHNGNINNTNR